MAQNTKFITREGYEQYIEGRFGHSTVMEVTQDGTDFYARITQKCDNVYYLKNTGFHRLDGPAVIYTTGSEIYYIENVEMSKEEYNPQVYLEVKQFIAKTHKPEDIKEVTIDIRDGVYYNKVILTNGNECVYRNTRLCSITATKVEALGEIVEAIKRMKTDHIVSAETTEITPVVSAAEQPSEVSSVKTFDERMEEAEKKIHSMLFHPSLIQEKTITFEGDDTYVELILISGNKHYYKNFKLHREDGPAMVCDYKRYFFIDGKEIMNRNGLLWQFQNNTLEYSTLNISEWNFIKQSIEPCKARAKMLAMYEGPQYYDGKVYMCNNGKDIIQALPGSKEFIFAKVRFDLGYLLEEFKRS